MYTVTRPLQWPDGSQVVEVSQGGLDLANPDLLAPRYPREGESFHNPVEAAMAAIEICRAWRRRRGGPTKGFSAQRKTPLPARM